MYSTVLTRKGQTTVPIEIRQKFGLVVGDKLDWIFKKNVVEVIPKKKFKDPLAVLCGSLKTKDSYAGFKRKVHEAHLENLK